MTLGPFGSWLIRTFKRAPSGTLLWPAASNAPEGRNASDPPATVTNPKPLSALNHLTLASTGSESVCQGWPRAEILRLPLGRVVVGRVVLIVTATLRATMIFVATHLRSISNRN